MNVVIFSTFKPFIKDFIVEQTNALHSWKNLRCKPKIVIIGNDLGVENICKKEKVINHKEVKKNEYGTPLVQDIFENGWKYANENDICIFVNGDIILTNSLCDGLEKFVKEYPNYNKLNYLITSIRYDWYNFKQIDFANPNWESHINQDMKGEYSPPSAIDIFIHRKGTINFIPDYSGIAKMSYDSLIMAHANKHFDVTINATKIIKIYHQFGKWYQNNKPCPRKVTRTSEMNTNMAKIKKLMANKNLTKFWITHCKKTW